MKNSRFMLVWAAVSAALAVPAWAQQQAVPAPQTPPAAPQRQQPEMDAERARRLYVSNDPKDHGTGVNFERQVQAKAETDRRYAEVAKGVADFSKVKYRSSVGDMDIPAYLFQPLQKRVPAGTRR